MDGHSNILTQSADDDYALALQLQEEYRVDEDDLPIYSFAVSRPELKNDSDVASNKRSSAIIDNSWELVDPNPDARELFIEFDRKYFWNKLSAVEVRWSSRMTLCAGVCCYEGRGGLCSIRLSEPLLKFRPRKDLIETLLHEMIHAYLFVTNNDRDHDAHGPEFLQHMYRLNKLTGANITVYHTFHDEVDNYRVHWWLCNGPCQKRPPFFGYVKRAMNRPPSSNDPWWSEHQRTCGGVFEKVKEPDKKPPRTNSAREKLPERAGGSNSIDKWLSRDNGIKSLKKPADFTSQPEATKTAGGPSGGIWGDFDSDSVPDALLMTAVDAVEHREVKMEHSQLDGKLHFPGQGQKLGKATATSIPAGSIVRRIPSVGLITGRSVHDCNQPRDIPVSTTEVTAAATNLFRRRSVSDCRSSLVPKSKSNNDIPNQRSSSASSIKVFESVADFRKTVGMVLSPPGTEVQVKNFVSVCNPNVRPLARTKEQLASRPKTGRLLSDDDTSSARPIKKMRSDDTEFNATVSRDSKKLSGDTLAAQMDRSVSVKSSSIVVVKSDSESDEEENKKHSGSGRDVKLEDSKTSLIADGMLSLEVDDAQSSITDEVVGGFGSSQQFFEQTGYVECPACLVTVPENLINEHLDQCLK